MRDFWTIFKQSFWTKAKTKSFVITTLIVVAGIFLMANLSSIISKVQDVGVFGEGVDDHTILVVDKSSSIVTQLQRQLDMSDSGITLKVTTNSNDELEKQITDKEIASFLVLVLSDKDTIQASYISENANTFEIPMTIREALQSVQTNIKANSLELTEEEVSQLFSPIQFEQTAVSASSKSEKELSEARGLVYVLIFVIYFAVFYYSNMIAMEVATEKSSRVMEIIISSVSPVKHMFAKIAGVGTLGLLQISLFGLVGFAALQTTSSDLTSGVFSFFGFANVSISTMIFAIVFFILGYFLYATLAALLGSLVSRTEDVQQILLPMTFLIIIASFVAFSGLGNPQATYVQIASYFPFFTPLVMFLRVGMLDLPVWEPVLGIGILLVTIFILGWFGSRVYRGGVLMYGASQSLKDIKAAIQLGKK
ncbi:ABC transporter permease [Paenisporosarcina antarctica]|uniref:ABC transporter permease n=1 Tax=Paenisporosarcina antarctica TaxID=417367 RepID=A0A4P6ZV95_9BACL|nr:ABC transporter permease [Paenisporosarcina antarctica]QBP40420.1 ABC transporter permease [Paenisporosarcina antarctica]